jgi:hypothetical protein
MVVIDRRTCMLRRVSQSGIALPTVLVFIVVLLILGFALTTYSTFEQQSSRKQIEEAQAFYVARAGASSLASYIAGFNISTDANKKALNDYVDAIATGVFGSYLPYTPDASASFRLKVELFDNVAGNGGTLVITSEGVYKNSSKSVIRELLYSIGPLSQDPIGVIDHAVFVMNAEPGNIDLGNGDIYYDGVHGSDITSHALGTNVYDPYLEKIKKNSNLSSAPASAISNPAIPPRSYVFPSETLPFRISSYTANVTIATRAISGNTVETITIPSGQIYRYNTLTIDGVAVFKTTGITYLLVDSLTVANSGKMIFDSSGPIFIITNSASLEGQIGCSSQCYTIKNGKYTHNGVHASDCFIGRVNFMYGGSDALEVAGSSYNQMNYIAGDALVDVKISGNSSFSGHIFTGASIDFKVNGTAEYHGLVYAPEADIRANGNPDIYGIIVGNSIDFNGNKMNVIYKKIMKSSLPFLYPDFFTKRGTNQDKGLHDESVEGGGGTSVPIMKDFIESRWR